MGSRYVADMRSETRGLFAVAILLATSCGGAATSIEEPAPRDPQRDAWQAWRAQRRQELVGPEGWLSLVGLYWLAPGQSAIGSDPASAIVLGGSAPAHLGQVIVGDEVRFVADPSVSVTRDGLAVEETTLTPDAPPLTIGSLRVVLIARGDRFALRVRDIESPAGAHFGELPVYDYDPGLRIRAYVREPEPGRMLSLVNALGMQVDEPCVAVLELTLDGVAIALAASAGGETDADHFFVMLRDETASAGETYGAGRYLDVPAADASGQTWVDFNRLYTPPCGYTPFATCPLPPEENVLAIAIRGGERYVHPEP